MMTVRKALPPVGNDADTVLAELELLKSADPKRAMLNANSMKGSREVQRVAKAAFNSFIEYNALYSFAFPSIAAMENDVLDIAVEIFRGGPDARGNITTGGTDSIFSAVHAMREWARAHKPHVVRPKLVVPYSAHPAFSKSAHYLGIELVRTSLASNYRADVEALVAAIDENTIGVGVSAPCWPYGLYDPIQEIAAMAEQRGLWCHVDACLGGYLAPFVKMAGFDLPRFEFDLPGVSSISADIHKYGHAPKPISTVLWRSAEQQRFHYHLVTDWPTGAYFTSSFAGSRPAGPLAATWAIFQYLGRDGKIDLARKTMRAKQRLEREVAAIKGLKVFKTDLTPFLFFSEGSLDLERVVGELTQRGWLMLGTPDPPLAQVTLDAFDDAVIDAFVKDLKEAVETAAKSPTAGPRVGLAYTFDERAEPATTSPKWFVQATPFLVKRPI
jgi:sphinganine-1-phosphate aldolase